MTALPATECVACKKTSMNGYSKDVANSVSRSPRQNRMAISAPNPTKPFRTMLNTIARGTTTAAFLISSLNYSQLESVLLNR